MKSNDKLIAVAIGSILVVGAVMVGILIGFPGGLLSAVRAQEPVTPTPKPLPTGEDLDRWEKMVEDGELVVEEMEVTIIIPTPTGGRSASPRFIFRPSQPGDRELRFRDSITLALPDDVELVYTTATLVTYGSPPPGATMPEPPEYYLEKGSFTVSVDSEGRVVRGWGDDDTPEEFPFLNGR